MKTFKQLINEFDAIGASLLGASAIASVLAARSGARDSEETVRHNSKRFWNHSRVRNTETGETGYIHDMNPKGGGVDVIHGNTIHNIYHSELRNNYENID